MDLSAGLRRDPPIDLEEVGESEALVARIRAEIEAAGPMTFARFMELALYDPDGGYYRGSELRPGRGGDFLTAPEAHPIFGQALANQLVEVWERLDRPTPFVVQEHGAGAGTLAEAILRRLERAGPELLAVLRYVPIEIDARRVEAFTARLAAAGFADRIMPEGEDRSFTGVVLANEVLDALPVHRIGIRDGSLAERFVAVGAEGRLIEGWGPPSSPALGERLEAEGVQLAEGQSAEVCLALDGWIADAVEPLERGLLLLIDYGAVATALYDAVRRPQGTVRAFARHRLSDDLYGHVGRQDLTAHVDLTALGRAADAAGLAPVGETSQAEFLIGNGAEALLQEVQADPATTLAGYVELRSALMRLIDPAGMGGFRVTAFGRAWPAGAPLAGFAYRGPHR
jgi:SAM-dependent MidA family methyltransferase